jgi:hypothetical protein
LVLDPDTNRLAVAPLPDEQKRRKTDKDRA